MMHVYTFISAVTKEFGTYRMKLRERLERHNMSIKIQENFEASGLETLQKLQPYLQNSQVVIHVVGDRTGATISPPSLAWIQQQYPDLANRFPVLREVLAGTVPSSYTQWEAYLAVYHDKMLLIAVPVASVKRDSELFTLTEAVPEVQRQQQQDHLARLKALHRHPEITFDSVEYLAAEVLRSRLYDAIVDAEVAERLNAGQIKAPLHNLPYATLGPLFKGRGALLRQLREKYAAATSGYKVLYGLGGIGKTRLAIEYAWQYRKYYSAVLFVRADKPADLEANLAALCEALVLNLPEREALEQEVQLKAVLEWLACHSGWLLILDNVDTSESALAVERWLPQLREGHVLVTARFSQWSRHVERLELDVLLEQDAVDFLLERTAGSRQETPTDRDDALTLSQKLGNLALALEQAGAYIEQRSISLASYCQRWMSNYQAVQEWSNEQLMGYRSSVAATWLTSFNELDAAAQTLLNRLAWLAAEPIPRTLLEVPVPDAAVLDPEESLLQLLQYSLATLSVDKHFFSIHQLVQDVTRTRLEGEIRRQTFEAALGHLDAVFIGEQHDVRTWPLLSPLQPHALAVTMKHASEFGNPEPTGRLLNNLGVLFIAKARIKEAEVLIRQVLSINEERYGPSAPVVASCLNNLVAILSDTNRDAEAEQLLRRALAIGEATLSPDDPYIATRLNNLAMILYDTNRQADAEPLMQRALSIDLAKFGPNHSAVTRDLNNLGLILHATNRLAEAESLYLEALATDEACFGHEHPSVARDLNNLAMLLQTTNRQASVELMLRRALAISETKLGIDHPTTARYLNNLAMTLEANERLAECELMLHRVLGIFTSLHKRSGHFPQYYQKVMNNYLQLMRKMSYSEEYINNTLISLGALDN
jgi:tetratricopeptide (TPR) repeat protein